MVLPAFHSGEHESVACFLFPSPLIFLFPSESKTIQHLRPLNAQTRWSASTHGKSLLNILWASLPREDEHPPKQQLPFRLMSLGVPGIPSLPNPSSSFPNHILSKSPILRRLLPFFRRRGTCFAKRSLLNSFTIRPNTATFMEEETRSCPPFLFTFLSYRRFSHFPFPLQSNPFLLFCHLDFFSLSGTHNLFFFSFYIPIIFRFCPYRALQRAQVPGLYEWKRLWMCHSDSSATRAT